MSESGERYEDKPDTDPGNLAPSPQEESEVPSPDVLEIEDEEPAPKDVANKYPMETRRDIQQPNPFLTEMTPVSEEDSVRSGHDMQAASTKYDQDTTSHSVVGVDKLDTGARDGTHDLTQAFTDTDESTGKRLSAAAEDVRGHEVLSNSANDGHEHTSSSRDGSAMPFRNEGYAQSQPDMRIDKHRGSDVGLVQIDEEETMRSLASAQDIEKEASEHLAQRSVEMSSHSSEHLGSDNAWPDSSVATKERLPASPPPPMPPRKDSMPTKLQPGEPQISWKHSTKGIAENNEISKAMQSAQETTGAEIQNIMGQFQEGMGGMGETEIMTPRLERQQSILVLPPRSSSLESKGSYALSPQNSGPILHSPSSPPGVGKIPVSESSIHRSIADDQGSVRSSTAGSIFQPPPPSPDPEPDLPFDFHRFLEQLRHRTADPVARFLRSFLSEFGKKQWMVHEQVKIISDFLEFITKKMGQCEVWRTVSDAEFDNAREGMEKLVMNRLYSQTFSPAIPPAAGSPRKAARGGRSQADVASPHGPGRRGQHQEDVERDDVIAQKIRIYGWIREEHLDIAPVGEKGKRFLTLAQQQLLKINTYRAPRDKVICVLNCCKVIFGFLKNSKSDQSADAFVPLMIYTVLRARPEHLVSNVQYIWRFRNQEKLGGEAGYYMSSLMGVVSFIENLDRTNLTISDEDFERNVEQAVSVIAEKNRGEDYEMGAHSSAVAGPSQMLSSKSTISRAEATPTNTTDSERSTPRRNLSQRLSEKMTASNISDDDDLDPVGGLLRTIQKPLNSIGRMFSDDASLQQQQIGSKPAPTPQPSSTARHDLSPGPLVERRTSADAGVVSRKAPADGGSMKRHDSAEGAAARQASIETAQAQRLRAQENQVVVETLESMFPNLDKDVIEDVVRAQEGNVGRAVDACLAMSG